MQVKAQLKSYEDLEFSITLVAPVCDWRVLRKNLEQIRSANYAAFPWPVSGFVACIDQMLSELDKAHADVLVKEKT